MPLHPKIASILQATAHLPRPPNLPLAQARAGFRERCALLPPPPVKLARIQDLVLGTSPPRPARLYVPEGEPPFPTVLFLHGGGFVLGDLDTHDGLCRRLSAGANALLLALDYRLAPEHPYPAATDDAWNALCWIAANIGNLGGDSARIGLAGDSAGGTLAAATALRSRDQHGPRLRAQVLFYPALDHYTAATPSYSELATGFGLTRESMTWYWDQYLTQFRQRDQAYAVPMRAASHAGLPPTLVITAEYDLLRDEGERYAAVLAAFGVEARASRAAGMNHGFAALSGIVVEADQAIAEASAWLNLQLRG